MLSKWFPQDTNPNRNQNDSVTKYARLKLQILEERTTPVVAFALAGTILIPFDLSAPNLSNAPIAITGLATGDSLVGIDVRPQNGFLYGLGYNSANGNVKLYALSTQTGTASQVGFTGAFVDRSGKEVRIGVDANTTFGFDFNPLTDRIRVVTSNGQNFRMNPNTGTFIDGDLGETAGSVIGFNMDGAIDGGTTTLDEAAHTNNSSNAGATTLYTIDSQTNAVYIQNPPNVGTQIGKIPITLGGNPFDFAQVHGFDIDSSVRVSVSNAGVTSGSAFAILSSGGTKRLYSINLVNGSATFVGTLPGASTIQGLAIQSPISSGSTNGNSYTGLVSGEVLVGIDYRPSTGQLFGLGINHSTDRGTLYLLDSKTRRVIIVGATSQVAFVDGSGNAIDFPDASTRGYGFDFDPVADLVRGTTSTGLNFRIHPDTGAVIDGDFGGATGSITGVNPDGNINGGPTGPIGIDAIAYTNSFGGATATTLYALDATSNSLFIQNSPNSGTQTQRLPITLNGTPLDFTESNAFTISNDVRVATSNTPVTIGFGLASLTVGGTTSLYRVNLVTGQTAVLGLLGNGTTPVTGLANGITPVGSVQFSGSTTSFGEQGGSVQITLQRLGGSSGSVSVDFQITGGNATSGIDFTSPARRITFEDSQITATIAIPITNDTKVEGNETIVLTLLNPTNGLVLGKQNVNMVTILDNDKRPRIPSPIVASGENAAVHVYKTDGSLTRTLNPFRGFTGSISVATGDVTGDGVVDIIVAAGEGGGPHIKVYNGKTFSLIGSFFAYNTNFFGGIYIAAGDIDNDGVEEIITGPGPGGGPNVRAFSLGGTLLVSFFAYDPAFPGGVRVASGAIDDNAGDDIVTAPGVGGGPNVRVFNGQGSLLSSFFAYNPLFSGGVFVAVDADGFIITGAGAGGGPDVRVMDVQGNLRGNFYAYNPTFIGGVRVAETIDARSLASRIVTAPGPGGGPHLKVSDGKDFSTLNSFFSFDPTFMGGVFVG